MEKAGQVKHSTDDADYSIALSACRITLTRSVVIVGNDTDRLVLLKHHFNPGNSAVFLQTSTKIINIGILRDNQLLT